jgi:hypothetical protein
LGAQAAPWACHQRQPASKRSRGPARVASCGASVFACAQAGCEAHTSVQLCVLQSSCLWGLHAHHWCHDQRYSLPATLPSPIHAPDPPPQVTRQEPDGQRALVSLCKETPPACARLPASGHLLSGLSTRLASRCDRHLPAWSAFVVQTCTCGDVLTPACCLGARPVLTHTRRLCSRGMPDRFARAHIGGHAAVTNSTNDMFGFPLQSHPQAQAPHAITSEHPVARATLAEALVVTTRRRQRAWQGRACCLYTPRPGHRRARDTVLLAAAMRCTCTCNTSHSAATWISGVI